MGRPKSSNTAVAASDPLDRSGDEGRQPLVISGDVMTAEAVRSGLRYRVIDEGDQRKPAVNEEELDKDRQPD
jgi:hypothetical protein